MSAQQLDQIVKGAPPPTLSPALVASAARSSPSPSNQHHSITAPHAPPSAIDSLPSSPAQIYLNLLILEASLRAQYLSLRARYRLHLSLLSLLALWTACFTYLLFLRPREDGSGVGGSVYWVVDMGERVGFVGGVVMAALFWGTGMWERGVRWPRRWVGATNRGLRGFNLKVVVIRGGWWREGVGALLGFVDPLEWVVRARGPGMRFELVPRESTKDRRVGREGTAERMVEEDVALGGDCLRLLLLPKPFSPDFRENWDSYRASFWEAENARRGQLRRIVNARDREIARKEGGWFWWMGWRGWRNLRARSMRRSADLETMSEKAPMPQQPREKKRRPSLMKERNPSHSRSSSRSSTPTPESDILRPQKRPSGEPLRRGSSTA
ncbi:hypothetical protein LTR28_006726, partial [Elasticomyces elasticus]